MTTLWGWESESNEDMSLSPQDLERINEIVKKHKYHGGDGCLPILFILFLLGLFKGCGY